MIPATSPYDLTADLFPTEGSPPHSFAAPTDYKVEVVLADHLQAEEEGDRVTFASRFSTIGCLSIMRTINLIAGISGLVLMGLSSGALGENEAINDHLMKVGGITFFSALGSQCCTYTYGMFCQE